MKAEISPGMIRTGVTGSYLGVGVWFFLGLLTLLVTSQPGWSAGEVLSNRFVWGVLLVLVAPIWVGAQVCRGIGWIGAGRMYGPLAAVNGWAHVVGLSAVLVLTALRQSIEVIVMVGGAYLLINNLVLMALLGPRGRPRRALGLVGAGMSLIGVAGLATLSVVEGPSTLVLIVMVGFLEVGEIIKHIGAGRFLSLSARRARELAKL